MDTNVFLARFAPGERDHEGCKRLIEATEAGNIQAIVSGLTLVEIASVVRRSSDRFQEKPSPAEAAGSFVRRALAMRNTSYVPLGGEVSFKKSRSDARIPLVFSAALKAARNLPLRTLDLLHLGAAYVAIRVLGADLGFFATLDEGILSYRREVKDFLGCPAITPTELVRLEGL